MVLRRSGVLWYRAVVACFKTRPHRLTHVQQVSLAPLVAVAGCLGVLGALAYPYAVSDVGVGLYYASGVINPLVAGLLAAVAVIILAAGREGRTDPGFAAGAGLVFGVSIVLILVTWGATARVDALEISRWHRWSAAAVAVFVPGGALWFARSLDVI